MKFAVLLAILASTASAETETPVFFFNGYSFTISAVKLKGSDTPESVTEKAVEV